MLFWVSQTFRFDPQSCVTTWKQIDLNVLRQFFLLWPLGEIGLVSAFCLTLKMKISPKVWKKQISVSPISSYLSNNAIFHWTMILGERVPSLKLTAISVSGKSREYGLRWSVPFGAPFRPSFSGANLLVGFPGGTQGSAAFEEQRCSLAAFNLVPHIYISWAFFRRICIYIHIYGTIYIYIIFIYT